MILSTTPIIALLEQWTNLAALKPPAQWWEHAEHISACFIIASGIYNNIYVKDGGFIGSTFLLSVQLLYEYPIREENLVGSYVDEATPPIRYRDLLGSDQIIKQQMMA